jgi:hypothetical protein
MTGMQPLQLGYCPTLPTQYAETTWPFALSCSAGPQPLTSTAHRRAEMNRGPERRHQLRRAAQACGTPNVGPPDPAILGSQRTSCRVTVTIHAVEPPLGPRKRGICGDAISKRLSAT